MPKYTEREFSGAIKDAIATGNIKAAAKLWNIPRSTLRDRLKGIESKPYAHAHEQRLSPIQEESLADWVLAQRSLGVAPTHSQLKEFAQRIIQKTGDNRLLGKNWIAGFLRRNPRVKTIRSKAIDRARLEAASPENIAKFFERLASPVIKRIPPQYRYNMDETGIMEGKGDNGLVLGSADDDFAPQKTPGSRVWTSILEAISATGVALPPLVIFKGLSLQHQWFPRELEKFDNWIFTSSPNGWTSDDIALEWLRRIFIPSTQPAEPRPRLLIVDGHGSHETIDFMWECYINDIFILYLPPHCSHILQPLDLSVFSVLKRTYRTEVQKLIQITDTTAFGKVNFLNCYVKARALAMKPETIRAGWKLTGLWPISMRQPLNNPWFIERQRQREKSKIHTPRANRKRPLDPEITILTPVHSSEVRKVMETLPNKEEFGPEARLLFRKVGTALDKHLFQIAEQEQRIQLLEAQVEHLRPKKRKKVKLGPNEKYATVPTLWKTREQIRSIEKQYVDDIKEKKISYEDHLDDFQLELDFVPEN